MRRLFISALVAGAAIVLGVAPAVSAKPAKPLCVGGHGCYPTLAAALAAANDGDTIHIGRGTFAGGVTITKSVTLDGKDAHESRISGGGPVLTIGSTTSTPTVTLSNLTITGGMTTSDPEYPVCGPDNSCAAGYASATALGGGIEAFPGTTVTLQRTVVTHNSAIPALTTPSAKATCQNGPCNASFGDAAGIDDWGTMTLVDSTVSDNHAAAVQSNGGGIVVEGGASLSLSSSRVTGNSASAQAPDGRFASGGGIFVDGGASLTVDHSSIDRNTSSLANSLADPYPMQGGSPDQENAYTGGVQLADGSSATIQDSTLDGNAVRVDSPLGEPYGADPALCACGEVALTIANTRIDDNRLDVNVLSSDVNGPSGPVAFESDGTATSISNTHVDGNTGRVTTSSGSASVIGALAFFPPDDTANTFTGGSISGNSAAATATDPGGSATVFGVGLLNNGTLDITASAITHNRGMAYAASGLEQGGGVWNGELFGGPTSALTLTDSRVTDNGLAGDPGITLQGGGIWNQGAPDFTVTLVGTNVAHNHPDQTYGF